MSSLNLPVTPIQSTDHLFNVADPYIKLKDPNLDLEKIQIRYISLTEI